MTIAKGDRGVRGCCVSYSRLFLWYSRMEGGDGGLNAIVPEQMAAKRTQTLKRMKQRSRQSWTSPSRRAASLDGRPAVSLDGRPSLSLNYQPRRDTTETLDSGFLIRDTTDCQSIIDRWNEHLEDNEEALVCRPVVTELV
jgi:hypothetical protein